MMVLTSSLMRRMSSVTSVLKRVRATISKDRAMLAVEGRGGDAALTHVDGVVGGDEAFAEEDLHAADGALLDEAGGLVDEDLADVVGIVDEDDGRAHEAVAGDVAVGPEEVLEEADGVAEFDPGLEGVEGKGVFQAGRHVPGACLGDRCPLDGWGFEGGRRGHGVETDAGMRAVTASRMRI